MDISLFRSIANQYEGLRSVHTVATIKVIGNLIEEQVINHKLAVDLFAGFQRFSDFIDEVPRYTRLGAVCRRVFVFGIPDVEPPLIPGIEFIRLFPGCALSGERFLLVNTPDFWTAMLAKEMETCTIDGQCFDGGWFCDEQVVERVALLISQVMGTFYQPVRSRNYVQQSAHIAELNRRMLERLEEAEISSHRRVTQLSTLHQFSAVLLQHQPLPCILRDAVQILSMIFGANEATIALNLQGDQFMIFSGSGNLNAGKQMSSLGSGPSGQALTQGKLISIADVRQSGEFDPLLPKAESILAAPIKGRRRVHGVVSVGNSESNGWNREDCQTVMAIAGMLAVIIEQKAQISGEVVLQLRRARKLEQLIAKLRKPVARLLSLQQKLQEEVHLLPVQKELMAEVEALFTDVAKMIGAPRSLPLHHESQLPTPSKATPNLDSKARTS